jgi:hypothetical protein
MIVTRRRAILHVGAADLATLLRLPDDIEITGYAVDWPRDSVAFRLESDRFEPVEECFEPRAIVAHLATEASDDGSVTRWVTWDGLDGAGYETRDVPTEPVAEKIANLREWLRMHGDYDVHLDLHAMYGTIRISVTLRGIEQWSDSGATLEKRLDRALAWLEAQK